MASEFWDIIRTANMTVPVWQMSILLVAIAVCLVFRLNGTGLILAFLFTFYLGWALFRRDILPKSPEMESYGYIYLACGALVLLLTIINTIMNPETGK